jgi:hypothetical protein
MRPQMRIRRSVQRRRLRETEVRRSGRNRVLARVCEARRGSQKLRKLRQRLQEHARRRGADVQWRRLWSSVCGWHALLRIEIDVRDRIADELRKRVRRVCISNGRRGRTELRSWRVLSRLRAWP